MLIRTDVMKPNNIKHLILVVLIICIGLSLRLYNLDADPDIRIDGDTGIFTDEGLYSLSARNLALFGKFNPNHESRVLEAVDSPIYTYTEYLSFILFGVTIKAMRFPSVIFGMLTVIGSYYLIRKIFGPLEGLLALLFLSINYLFIQFNRLALLETLMIFLYLMSLYFYLVKGETRWGLFLSGIFAGIALITKGTAIFFFGGILLTMVFEKTEKRWWRHTAKSYTLYFLGVLTVIIINKVYLYLVLKDLTQINAVTNDLLQAGKKYFVFNSLGEWLKRFTQIIISRFSVSMPEIFIFVYFYAIWIFGNFKRPETRRDKAIILFLFWLTTGIFTFSFFEYQPNRYRIPFILPLSMLAAIGITKIYRTMRITLMNKGKYYLAAFSVGVTLVLFRITRVTLVSMFGVGFKENEVVLMISVIISLGIVLLAKKYAVSEISFSHYVAKGAVFVFIFVFINIQLGQYVYWLGKMTYQIKDGNNIIKSLVNEGNIGGEYAPILSVETDNVVVPLHKEDRKIIPRLHLTHYIDSVDQQADGTYQLLNQSHPGFLDRARLLAKMKVGYVFVSVYALDY